MIVSYRNRRTLEFAEGRRVREFDGSRRQAEERLDILDAATSHADFRALPSNAPEVLTGDRKGQHRIRINLQWRTCFEWPDDQRGPSHVEIVDYH